MRGRAGPIFAALAVVGVLILGVFPTKAWLDQRQQRKALAGQLATLSAENQALEARAAQLRTDEEVERLARQYNLVKPGEETYFILPRADTPAASPAAPAPKAPPPPPPEPSPSLWDRITGIF